MVDGKKIVLKDFVQDILANTVYGLVSSLKAPDTAAKIELRIQPAEGDNLPVNGRQEKQTQ